MTKIITPYIQDILKSINVIELYLAGINHDRATFDEQMQVQDAIIRRLEVIGEATKRLDEEYKRQYPHIPWRKMAGMRDVLAHDYDEIDLDLIWEVVINDLPSLKDAVSALR